ncbi:DNA polymerase III subunit delta [Mycoplasmoides genitalium]
MTIIYGQDIGLIHQKLSQIKSNSPYKTIWFKDLKQLYDLFSQPLFGSNNEKFIVNNCSFLEKTSLTRQENLCLEKLKTTDVILTVYTDNPFSGIKTIKSITTVFCDKLDWKSMHKAIGEVCRELNLKLDLEIIDWLANALPLNMGVIYQEINKLSLLGKNEIKDNKLVETVICDYQPVQIYKLTKALTNSQIVKAFKYIDELASTKPNFATQFLEFFSGELLLALMVKSCNPKQLTNINLNVNQFRLIAIQSQYHNFTSKVLVNIINAIQKLDIKLKHNDGFAIPLLKNFALSFFTN